LRFLFSSLNFSKNMQALCQDPPPPLEALSISFPLRRSALPDTTPRTAALLEKLNRSGDVVLLFHSGLAQTLLIQFAIGSTNLTHERFRASRVSHERSRAPCGRRGGVSFRLRVALSFGQSG
jgi:hypothetical protein